MSVVKFLSKVFDHIESVGLSKSGTVQAFPNMETVFFNTIEGFIKEKQCTKSEVTSNTSLTETFTIGAQGFSVTRYSQTQDVSNALEQPVMMMKDWLVRDIPPNTRGVRAHHINLLNGAGSITVSYSSDYGDVCKVIWNSNVPGR